MACRKLHNIYRIKLIGPAKTCRLAPYAYIFHASACWLENKSSKKVVKEQKGTFKRRNMKKKRMITPPPLTSLSNGHIILHFTHLFDE